MTSKRQRARADRQAAALRTKLADAHTPADRAAVEYDLTRAAIQRLPEPRRAAAYAGLTRALTDYRTALLVDTGGTAEVHNFTSQPGEGVSRLRRAAARGRARARDQV